MSTSTFDDYLKAFNATLKVFSDGSSQISSIESYAEANADLRKNVEGAVAASQAEQITNEQVNRLLAIADEIEPLDSDWNSKLKK
jgi:DNA-binding FadR family transcriptional regulator